MKKALFVILILALVFTLAVPVSLGAPDTSASPDASASPSGTDDSIPDDEAAAPSSAFEVLESGSSGIRVFKVQMRLRDLGYLNYRPTGSYKTLTQNAVISFQRNNGLDTDGQVGQMTYEKLFSADAARKPLGASVKVYYGPSLVGTAPAPGKAADWATVVDPAFPVGATATVTDYNTGSSFTVQRTGGTGHADVEVVDSAAYETFKTCFGIAQEGAEPTWEKRAVLVTVGSEVYAASLFGHPDGTDTIADNGMNGHVCLYFMGSTSDVLGFVDKEHYKMVLTAAGLPLQYQ